MEYQTIRGEKVPVLGLGTYRLTGEACVRAVGRALSMGYRQLDTADVRQRGRGRTRYRGGGDRKGGDLPDNEGLAERLRPRPCEGEDQSKLGEAAHGIRRPPADALARRWRAPRRDPRGHAGAATRG